MSSSVAVVTGFLGDWLGVLRYTVLLCDAKYGLALAAHLLRCSSPPLRAGMSGETSLSAMPRDRQHGLLVTSRG